MKGYQKAFDTSKEWPEGRENERLTKWAQTYKNEILKLIYQVSMQQCFANRGVENSV